jgi:hypothetical protein
LVYLAKGAALDLYGNDYAVDLIMLSLMELNGGKGKGRIARWLVTIYNPLARLAAEPDDPGALMP